MSTAGKVLVVLIALPTLLWLWLASGVAHLNREWGKRVSQLGVDIAKASDEIGTTRTDIFGLKSRIDLAQRERDDRLTAARGVVSQLYKQDSFTKETLDRYNLQDTGMQLASEGAGRRLDSRVAELAETRKALSDAQAELTQLKEQNTRDREHLAALRQEFQATLEENKSLIARAQANGNQARSRSPRAVSLAR